MLERNEEGKKETITKGGQTDVICTRSRSCYETCQTHYAPCHRQDGSISNTGDVRPETTASKAQRHLDSVQSRLRANTTGGLAQRQRGEAPLELQRGESM